MKRYPHYWWQLHGSRCPTRIAVACCDWEDCANDSQSTPVIAPAVVAEINVTSFRAGVPVARSQVRSGSAAGMWNALARLVVSREQCWVFMENAYDTLTRLGFWGRLEDGEFELCGRDWKVDRGVGRTGEDHVDGLCIIEDPPTLISCRPVGAAGKWLLLDLRNYGIDGPGVGLDAAQRADYYASGIREIVQTLRQGRAVSIRATAASQAVQILRTRYDCLRLHCHTNANALRLERAAYFGGRCECYRLGAVPTQVYHVDVRSMYPSICLNLPIPVSIVRYTDDGRIAEDMVRSCPDRSCADVSVLAGTAAYPFRQAGEVIYPRGRFRTCLSGPEISAAVLRGDICRVYQAAEYTCATYLREFYRDMLGVLSEMSQLSSAVGRMWTKRVMNGLVGRFGEPGRRWVPTTPRAEMGPFVEWPDYGPDGQLTRFRNIASYTQRLETHGESYWSMPAVAGWITAAGRVRLWDYITTAGRENVWYCDTDALLCNRDGYDRLLRSGHIREGETGYLRTLGCYSRCVIYGIRHYQLDDTIWCAGVPRGTIRPGETREDYWRRLKPAAEIALGLRPGESAESIPGGCYTEYRHGKVDNSGVVTPWEIDDGS